MIWVHPTGGEFSHKGVYLNTFKEERFVWHAYVEERDA